MTIHDPALFSLVVPTFEGTRFLRRLLDYLARERFEGSIVLSDNSSGEHRDYVASCARAHPDLDIDVHLYPHDVRFLDKLADTLSKVDSRFVMLHAHDDFMVADGVNRCVEFLANHPEYCVARGRVAMLEIDWRADGATTASLVPHPMRGYEADDPAERVLEHMQSYAPTFYSVHERRQLIESFAATARATDNVIFFQYLSSCLSVYRGKVWCSDDLFYVRQGHAGSWSGTLRRGDYEHWPMLITSPDFSRYYQEFRAALCALLGGDAMGERIDRAAVALISRGLCGAGGDHPEEARFLKRLQEPGSREHGIVAAIVAFATAYPDTL